MKPAIIIFSLFLSLSSFAADCIDAGAKHVIKDTAKYLGVDESELQTRFVGGHAIMNDVVGEYIVQASHEVYDVFLKGENPKTDKALRMVILAMNSYFTDTEILKLEKCEPYEIIPVPSNEWQLIYEDFE